MEPRDRFRYWFLVPGFLYHSSLLKSITLATLSDVWRNAVMPKYHYQKAFIYHDSFGSKWMPVRAVSEGITILNAIGEGCVKLTGSQTIRSKSYRTHPDPVVAFSRLIDQPPDEVFRRFDQMTDIDLGRLEIASTMPDFYPDELQGLDEESKWRLAHFAGLLIAKCGNVGYEKYRFVGHDDWAMIGAGLDEGEIGIARRYVTDFKVQELLARRYKYY